MTFLSFWQPQSEANFYVVLPQSKNYCDVYIETLIPSSVYFRFCRFQQDYAAKWWCPCFANESSRERTSFSLAHSSRRFHNMFCEFILWQQLNLFQLRVVYVRCLDASKLRFSIAVLTSSWVYFLLVSFSWLGTQPFNESSNYSNYT